MVLKPQAVCISETYTVQLLCLPGLTLLLLDGGTQLCGLFAVIYEIVRPVSTLEL